MAAKKGLYYNINKRKKAGTSRSKKNSTISAKNYRDAKRFPNSKKNKAKRKSKLIIKCPRCGGDLLPQKDMKCANKDCKNYGKNKLCYAAGCKKCLW